jgi:xylose isomerase
MLGSIDANIGDLMLGWDTDEFPYDVYDTTMCMYEVLKYGGFTNGGFNFDAKNRRPSYELMDMFLGFILGMDTFALGLIKAAAIIEDGRIDKFVAERYASYQQGIGAKILSGKATLTELAEYAAKLGKPEMPGSGRQEYLESVVNSILFG